MTNFDEYELFMHHVQELTERRQNITTIYLSANAAIITGMTLIFTTTLDENSGKNVVLLGLMITGIVACDLWRRLINQYSLLLGWWYSKLRELEQGLQDSHKLLSQEYSEFYKVRKSKPTIGLTRYEVMLAWLFTAIYAILILTVIISALFSYHIFRPAA